MPETEEELVLLIADTDGASVERRIQAISRLGEIYREKNNPQGLLCLLERVQKDPNHKIVTHCVTLLGKLRVYSAVMLIIDVALACRVVIYESSDANTFRQSDDSLRLRCAAVQALGWMGDDRAILPLMSILNNRTENYRLRLAAAESLGKLGDGNAVNPLLDILSDEREKSVYLKESAAKALGMLGDIRALEPLIDVLESKRGIRDKFNFLKEQIIEAIGRIGKRDSKATGSLVRALKDEAASIRLAAVEALGELGDPQCIDSVRELIFDKEDDVAVAAISAMYSLGGEPAIRELLTLENLPQFLRDELESYIP